MDYNCSISSSLFSLEQVSVPVTWISATRTRSTTHTRKFNTFLFLFIFYSVYNFSLSLLDNHFFSGLANRDSLASTVNHVMTRELPIVVCSFLLLQFCPHIWRCKGRLLIFSTIFLYNIQICITMETSFTSFLSDSTESCFPELQKCFKLRIKSQ